MKTMTSAKCSQCGMTLSLKERRGSRCPICGQPLHGGGSNGPVAAAVVQPGHSQAAPSYRQRGKVQAGFFKPYEPDAIWSRSLRAVLLTLCGGFLSLFLLACVVLIGMSSSPTPALFLSFLGGLLLGLCLGALIDGLATFGKLRITLAGRLLVGFAALTFCTAWGMFAPVMF